MQKALQDRLAALSQPGWVDDMVLVIQANESSGFFRWHDSGDLQGVWHLEKIAEVCRRTPAIKHWLPTKEFGFVSEFLKTQALPENLVVRLSAFMVDGPTPDAVAARLGVQVSGVSRTAPTCPSSANGNKCLTCRACWDKQIYSVIYKKH